MAKFIQYHTQEYQLNLMPLQSINNNQTQSTYTCSYDHSYSHTHICFDFRHGNACEYYYLLMIFHFSFMTVNVLFYICLLLICFSTLGFSSALPFFLAFENCANVQASACSLIMFVFCSNIYVLVFFFLRAVAGLVP